MDHAFLEELRCMKQQLLMSMEDYMSMEKIDDSQDVSYNRNDISECRIVLDEYLESLKQLGKHALKDEVMECVKNVVLRLNELYAKRPDLIEDSERDTLREYIEFAAKGAGLKDVEEDITEEWREW